jgi:hypothetical protein
MTEKEIMIFALYHLRAVSGSRNSFSLEVIERLFGRKNLIKNLRTDHVEKMHREAVEFLHKYEHLIND